MLPYTERFIQGQGSGKNVLAYQVPAGRRAIVRCIDIVNLHGTAAQPYIHINGTIFAWWNVLNTGEHVQWQGRQVAYAGESLQAKIDFCQITITGYLLS